ncbi:Transcriptional regulatory protein WalR [subsurface metagenome]
MEKKARILAVDDDEKVLRVIEALLTPHGYEVIPAHDGQQAITAMTSAKPDLVLMDIFMPKMDGYTALGVIKNDVTTREVPVVMVTAVGQELNKKFAESLGAAGYITKPFKSSELLDIIDRFLATS